MSLLHRHQFATTDSFYCYSPSAPVHDEWKVCQPDVPNYSIGLTALGTLLLFVLRLPFLSLYSKRACLPVQKFNKILNISWAFSFPDFSRESSDYIMNANDNSCGITVEAPEWAASTTFTLPSHVTYTTQEYINTTNPLIHPFPLLFRFYEKKFSCICYHTQNKKYEKAFKTDVQFSTPNKEHSTEECFKGVQTHNHVFISNICEKIIIILGIFPHPLAFPMINNTLFRFFPLFAYLFRDYFPNTTFY